MSQEVNGSMVRISGLFHLPINGAYWGLQPTYEPFTNFLEHPSKKKTCLIDWMMGTPNLYHGKMGGNHQTSIKKKGVFGYQDVVYFKSGIRSKPPNEMIRCHWFKGDSRDPQ